MEMKKPFWTENEAAELCGVPYWRLKYLRDTGRITPLKVGRALAYSDTDVKIARVLIEAQGERRRRVNNDEECNKRENE